MSRGGIIIQNRGDGRGMMLPEREGSGTFNKLPFVSMACPKEEIGINPIPSKVIIKTIKVNPKLIKDKKKEMEDKLYPLENYRKIKTSQQFWKKNENPIYKEYNKNENKTIIKNQNINNNNEYIKEKTVANNIKVPKKLKPIINKSSLTKKQSLDEIQKDDNSYEVKPEIKEVKVIKEINNEKKERENTKEMTTTDNNLNKENECKEEQKDENIKDFRDKKYPLLEEDLEDNENINDILNYLNGLDYDKYCKDMEIREALTLLKNKMDKELKEKEIEDEKNNNNDLIEGEKPSEEKKNKVKENNEEKEEDKGNKEDKINKLVLPEINKAFPEPISVEIINEEELKRKEEIKKYKIAEQIAKTDEMKAVHSVNSIKKLLQREGLDKINEPAPLKITVIKENPLANLDGYEANKLPFLHSLPLV